MDTDIQFGQNCAFHTLCVLTGITDQKMLENTDSVPEYYGNSVSIFILIDQSIYMPTNP